MSGGGSFTSDQKTAHLAADGQLVGRPCRVTSIQAKGNNANCSVILYDNTSAAVRHTLLSLEKKDCKSLFLEAE